MKRMNLWKYNFLDGICTHSINSSNKALQDVYAECRSNCSAYCSTLTSKERDETMYEFDFFTSFITIGGVIRAFNKLSIQDNALFFKQQILLNSDKILPINAVLARYYRAYVSTHLYEHTKFFNYIIDIALSASSKNIFIDYYRRVLGDRLYKIAYKQLYVRKSTLSTPVDIPFDKMQGTINNILNNITDKTMRKIWGEKYVNTSSELIDKIEPYTAYYNIPVLSTITYTGSSIQKLKHSVLFNAYPGLDNMMAHFINNDMMDMDAHVLFLGFATFATLHYDKDEYTRNLKHLFFAISKIMLNKNYINALDEVYMYLSKAVPSSISIIFLELINCYPTIIPSEGIGSVAVETLIHSGFSMNPADFLEKLKLRHIGNFFCIWDDEINKKR